ncbi:Clp1/GlmU family protein [Conexivisphaera calida]|uniref:polynucleotide 5'-hydroxyl-kinase n=1 Tax=Conexivisphaera calida TaxID=1874277 RepID=A0A4P2VBF7_9ARCH|nr:Clp1/GlmU family protein [Conexivisphaera calida]BBE41859.1 hypothetical protein NAS2_0470 [Conexivisphaera calida]
MAGEFEVPSGFTLTVRGPGSAEVVEGEVIAFGARLTSGSRLQIPEGRTIPLEAVVDSFIRSSTESAEVVKGSTVPKEWEELAKEALDRSRVMVIGANDTGKSSLILYMVNRALAAGRRPAIVDADIGQTDIGPAGTIGLAFPRNQSPVYSGFEMSDAYFVGDKSPVGHLLPMVVGSRLMVDRAIEAGAAPVFVNTTGFVEGSSGWALKTHKVEALEPDLLIAIERGEELRQVLRSIPRNTRVRRARPPGAVMKERADRARYRVTTLTSIASRRTPMEVNLRDVRLVNARTLLMPEDGELRRRLEAATGIRPELVGVSGDEAVAVFRERLEQKAFSYAMAILEGAGEPRIVNLDRLEGLYLGLMDPHDKFIGVGRLLKLEPRHGTMRGEAVLFSQGEIGGVVFGYLLLDDEWREIGTIKPGYL